MISLMKLCALQISVNEIPILPPRLRDYVTRQHILRDRFVIDNDTTRIPDYDYHTIDMIYTSNIYCGPSLCRGLYNYTKTITDVPRNIRVKVIMMRYALYLESNDIIVPVSVRQLVLYSDNHDRSIEISILNILRENPYLEYVHYMCAGQDNVYRLNSDTLTLYRQYDDDTSDTYMQYNVLEFNSAKNSRNITTVLSMIRDEIKELYISIHPTYTGSPFSYRWIFKSLPLPISITKLYIRLPWSQRYDLSVLATCIHVKVLIIINAVRFYTEWLPPNVIAVQSTLEISGSLPPSVLYYEYCDNNDQIYVYYNDMYIIYNIKSYNWIINNTITGNKYIELNYRLHDYVIRLRIEYNVIFMLLANRYTNSSLGWSSILSRPYENNRRYRWDVNCMMKLY